MAEMLVSPPHATEIQVHVHVADDLVASALGDDAQLLLLRRLFINALPL